MSYGKNTKIEDYRVITILTAFSTQIKTLIDSDSPV